MKLVYHPIELHLKHPFGIARGTRTSQHNLIVELQQDGYSGYGEAASNPYYGTTIEGMTKVLEQWRPQLEQEPLDDHPSFWDRWQQRLKDHPFLLAALDVAALDLRAQIKACTLREYLKIGQARTPITSFTIGLDKPQKMVAKLKEMPWPAYKIKLGGANDLETLQSLRAITKSPFRLDANAGWNTKEALKLLPKLAQLGVDIIEQPLAADNWSGMQELKQNSDLLLIADESFDNLDSLEKCAAHFHGINIKLMKCGGLTPALDIINQARKLGLKIMIGGMAASSIANTAAAQLLPLVDIADLDGPLLFRNDAAEGIQYHFGKMKIPDGPGLGLKFIAPNMA